MSFAKKHNTEKLFTFEIPEGFVHKDLRDLVEENGIEKEYKINAIYINKKGKFGPQPVFATDNELVNIPHHMVDVCKEILEDGESVATINNGHAGFKLYEYENNYGQQLSVEFVDIK